MMGMILVAGDGEAGVWCRHAGWTKLGELDCGIFGEPSAFAEQAGAYVWDTDHSFVAACAVGDDCVAQIAVGGSRAVLFWMAAAVCWA